VSAASDTEIKQLCDSVAKTWSRATMAAKDSGPPREPERPVVPMEFGWARFDAPELAVRTSFAARRLAEARSTERGWIVLVGAAGTGKTSLLVSMLRAACAHRPRIRFSALFVPAHSIARAREQYPLGEGEPPLIERATRSALVALDDLGSERESSQGAIVDLIFDRRLADRCTWATTGLSADDVANRYGGGFARRLFERSTVIACERPA